MPYLPSDAEKKSELYNKIINADKFELSSKIENLKSAKKYKKKINSLSLDCNWVKKYENKIREFAEILS